MRDDREILINGEVYYDDPSDMNTPVQERSTPVWVVWVFVFTVMIIVTIIFVQSDYANKTMAVMHAYYSGRVVSIGDGRYAKPDGSVVVVPSEATYDLDFEVRLRDAVIAKPVGTYRIILNEEAAADLLSTYRNYDNIKKSVEFLVKRTIMSATAKVTAKDIYEDNGMFEEALKYVMDNTYEPNLASASIAISIEYISLAPALEEKSGEAQEEVATPND